MPTAVRSADKEPPPKPTTPPTKPPKPPTTALPTTKDVQNKLIALKFLPPGAATGTNDYAINRR